MKLPEYVLDHDVEVMDAQWDKKILPAGIFLKPIDIRWVPKHVLEGHFFKYFKKDTETCCYTHFGMMPIPNKFIRKIGEGL